MGQVGGPPRVGWASCRAGLLRVEAPSEGGAHRAGRLGAGQQGGHLQAHALLAHALQPGHHLRVLPPAAWLPVHGHDVVALLEAGCLRGRRSVRPSKQPPWPWPRPPPPGLTAARPPGITAAMSTGASPRSVKPKPPSPRVTCTGPTSRQRFLAENTDRGPWGHPQVRGPACSTTQAVHRGAEARGCGRAGPLGASRGSKGGKALTSRWKMSATSTCEKLGALTSGLWYVLAERAKVRGDRAEPTAHGPREHGWMRLSHTQWATCPSPTSGAWLHPHWWEEPRWFPPGLRGAGTGLGGLSPGGSSPAVRCGRGTERGGSVGALQRPASRLGCGRGR